MKRLILVLVAALIPSLALGAEQSWAKTGTRSVVGVCAAGTTCDIPSDATKGMQLNNVTRISIEVCADSGQTITGGSGILLYAYDATSGLWGQFNATAYTVKTGARCAWVQGSAIGVGIEIAASRGRLAAVPSGMTVSSGSLTVYMNAVDANGNSL